MISKIAITKYKNICLRYTMLEDFMQKKIEMLTREEEEAIIYNIINKKDKKSREKLILAYTPLVESMSAKYKNKGIDLEEIRQECYVGLIRAVDKYDQNYNNIFSNYAKIWIKEAIQSLFIRSNFLYIPINTAKAFYSSRKTNLTSEELKDRGLSKNILENLNFVDHFVTSLDEPVNEDKTKIDYLKSNDFDPVKSYELKNNKSIIKKILSKLNSQQKKVIILRFGIYGQDTWSLNDIGKEMGVSSEYIRQIQEKSLKILKKEFIYLEKKYH